MWLLAGLGNPGKGYELTRHNVGFMFIDKLCALLNIKLRDYGSYAMVRAFVEGRDIVIVKPMTYMNRSGESIGRLSKELPIPPERIVIVHDDLDMALGKIRIRRKGSSGGHRGVQSIIETVGENFIRLKIGIGRSAEIPPEEYVLQRFSAEEMALIGEAIEKAIQRLFDIIPSQES